MFIQCTLQHQHAYLGPAMYDCAHAFTTGRVQAAPQQPPPAAPQAPAAADKPASQLQSPPPKPPSFLPAGSKRRLAEASQPANTRRRITPESTSVQPSPTATTAAGGSTSQQQAQGRSAGAVEPAASIVFEQQAGLHAELGREALPLGDQPEAGVRVVEALQQAAQWQVVCHSGGLRQWSDEVQGQVTAVGGSMHFSAAGFQSGALQVCKVPHTLPWSSVYACCVHNGMKAVLAFKCAEKAYKIG